MQSRNVKMKNYTDFILIVKLTRNFFLIKSSLTTKSKLIIHIRKKIIVTLARELLNESAHELVNEPARELLRAEYL